jgi:hypothetical protein
MGCNRRYQAKPYRENAINDTRYGGGDWPVMFKCEQEYHPDEC